MLTSCLTMDKPMSEGHSQNKGPRTRWYNPLTLLRKKWSGVVALNFCTKLLHLNTTICIKLIPSTPKLPPLAKEFESIDPLALVVARRISPIYGQDGEDDLPKQLGFRLKLLPVNSEISLKVSYDSL